MLGLEQGDAAEAIKAMDDFEGENTNRFWQTDEKAEAAIDQADALLRQYRGLQFRDVTPDGDQREKIIARIDAVADIQRAATGALMQMLDSREERERAKRAQEERDRIAREEEAERESERESKPYERERRPSDFDKWQSGEDESYNYMTRMEESKMRISKSRLQKMIKEEFKRANK
jgi:hypothetical protein